MKPNKIIILAVLDILLSFSVASPAQAQNGNTDCDAFNFGGECETTIITEGETTTRNTEWITEVEHYEEEWGGFSEIMLAGYWQPAEGQTGVIIDSDMQCGNPITKNGKRYCRSADLVCAISCDWGSGMMQGLAAVYHNGEWEAKKTFIDEPISNENACINLFGVWEDRDWDGEMECWSTYPPFNEITDQVALYEIVYEGPEACEYRKEDGFRWFDSWDEINTYPVEDVIIEEWEYIEVVTHYWGVSVQVPYPCAGVTRTPYPRAIVGEPSYFTVTADTITASAEVSDVCTPDVESYLVEVRIVPIESISPVWVWDERSFSDNPTVSEGWTVSHTWDTSSYSLDGECEDLSCDKPLWGPSLIGEWLPAYKVNVYIAYQLEVRRTWTDWYGQVHDTGWEAIDLTTFGYNTSFLILSGARDVTIPQAGAMAPKEIYECIVPVPVIEAQSILSGD
jgi:hypothetical protein